MKPTSKKMLSHDWHIIHPGKSIEVIDDAPITVFEACIKNDLIPDPFYGTNEQEVKWVYESDWIFVKEFELSPQDLAYTSIMLCFHGLDTIADVFLNDTPLGTCKNMHRSYTFSIREICNEGINYLKIHFQSPLKIAKAKAQEFKTNLNTGPAGIPGIPYLRKAQYSFGWDWGPQLPDIGIWKPVELIFWDNCKIQSVHIKSDINFVDLDKRDPLTNLPLAHSATIKAEINLELIDSDQKNQDLAQSYLLLTILDKDDEIFHSSPLPIVQSQILEGIHIDKPILWWTHDLSTPQLYTAVLKLYCEEKLVDSWRTSFGIRELQLIQEKDKWGRSFFFRLNHLPIFIKGANWIPVDSFIPRGFKQGLYTTNIQAAQDANFNMLRVWGGGIYEIDEFYQLCDEMGILVWQDFPFACALYPADQDFRDEIEAEARENIIRLRNHASLALWCGNNEIENLWIDLQWQAKSIANRKEHKNAYQDYFYKLLPDLVKELDEQRNYWPSSPTRSDKKTNFGYFSSNSQNFGDSHYWLVWHGGFPFKAYRRFFSLFMSEFGFESFPEIETINTFCPAEEHNFYSPVMENHQKNPAGNKKIFNYMKKRFQIPPSFAHQAILSQITQAEAIEYGVEHWRRNRTNNRCMGALYWQLNDCWPVASWSSIDYYGRWKALHYFARRFFTPLFPSIEESSRWVKIWMTNDLPRNVAGTLEYWIQDATGKTYEHESLPIESKELSSQLLRKIRIYYTKIWQKYVICLSRLSESKFTPPRRISFFPIPTSSEKIPA
ncbi:MAG: glycoside hydrolase family 2 protein [Promethearchaeota archaeon]